MVSLVPKRNSMIIRSGGGGERARCPVRIERTLSHHHTAHEHLDRPDTLQRNLALPRRLPQTQLMSEFLLADGVRVIDFVAEDQEGDFGQVFHGQEGVELGFGFREAFVVFGVDEEDDAAYFGEVVAP